MDLEKVRTLVLFLPAVSVAFVRASVG